MESLLCTITQHAMNYAIRSGIAITSGYAIQQCNRLLKTVKSQEREEIDRLKNQLEYKIRIISPAIDMIELIAARGNTSLDSAVALTKSIRVQIQSLGSKLAGLVDEDHENRIDKNTRSKPLSKSELHHIICALKSLLTRIEDAVPLINLAIATSGVNLSTMLPPTVSPSRLLQASMFLSTADSAYAADPAISMQVGPAYTLSIYMLFGGHANRQTNIQGIRETTWKEVIHKARVKLVRVPMRRLYETPSQNKNKVDPISVKSRTESQPFFQSIIPSESQAHEFAYQLLFVEDLNDGRFHTFDQDSPKPGPYEDVQLAGIREIIPIHEISKIFYADTGKILNIGSDGEPNNPVLLLKRDVDAVPPRNAMDLQDQEYDTDNSDDRLPEHVSNNQVDIQTRGEKSCQSWKFPKGLDLTWIAFEVYSEDLESSDNEANCSSPESEEEEDSASELPSSPPVTPRANGSRNKKSSALLKRCSIDSSFQDSQVSQLPMPLLKNSLSLLELLIRLSSLQQFQQCSHLTINDELLNFFLSESNSTGTGVDAERRKILRNEARHRVGFDPYAESPYRVEGREQWQKRETIGEDLEFDEAERPHIKTISPKSRSGQSISSPSSLLPVRLASRPAYLDSSPSLRAQARSSVRASTATGSSHNHESRLQFSATGKPAPHESSLLRSESDSTLGTSPVAPQSSNHE